MHEEILVSPFQMVSSYTPGAMKTLISRKQLTENRKLTDLWYTTVPERHSIEKKLGVCTHVLSLRSSSGTTDFPVMWTKAGDQEVSQGTLAGWATSKDLFLPPKESI